MKICGYILVFTVVFFTTACKQKSGKQMADVPDTTEVKAIPAEQLIEPGVSIGHIKLNSSLDSAASTLGRPDCSDAAMGSALYTWYADHDTTKYKTSIFAHRNMGGKDEAVQRIKKILVTSPWFKTSEYISTGNTLADIKKYYTLKQGNNHNAQGQTIQTYTDTEKGISFEINPSGKCVGILVYQPNSSADASINMH
ncbi:hypothetical protein DYU05_18980 [Mucilaginibacter terrenus]|uniref:Lipoprotein n=1 Tax=Mucilaginibacter terrenus TaxID=2482727 RepID=A0A3E2NK44_9SPHI|nr:hypothetical protein [Mucilaginibacter terrenus]RFZ81369.1 hypothetical protein DYU05_18980 [Mucilaginibacter terrenus]